MTQIPSVIPSNLSSQELPDLISEAEDYALIAGKLEIN